MRTGTATMDDTLLLERPPGQRRQRPASAPTQGTRFEAPTPYGLLQLLARTDLDSAGCAAQAAVLLEGCADLLGALDTWLGQDLAWRWPASNPVVTPGADGPHWPAAASQLQAPWVLWRALPAPPPLLAQGLLWPEVQALLSLGWLALDEAELAALEPGGAVLLPPTPGAGPAGASCRLRALDEAAGPQVGLPLVWQPDAPPHLLPPGSTEAEAPPAPAGATLFELRLSQPLPVPGRLLTGWCSPALPRLAPDAGLYRGSAALAQGTLVPWGDGWALLVRSAGSARA
jgi:hypothetical protein